METYMGDFETVINPEKTWVWASCLVDVETNETVQISNNIDETYDFLSKRNSILYYHNLKFDGEFWVSYLLNRGYVALKDEDKNAPGCFRTLITQDGAWYCLEIYFELIGKKRWNKVTIYDSLKKLPFKVERIAKAFKLPICKLKIDYKAVQEPGHILTTDEIKYIETDCKIVAAALKVQFENGLERMTIGSDALHSFTDIMEKKRFEKFFPVLPLALDQDMRRAYKGGFTWLKPEYKNVRVGAGIKLDVNSLYPAVMYNELLPYGYPMYFEGEPMPTEKYPLFIVRFRCQFEIKPDHIPTITLKHTRRTQIAEYLTSSENDFITLTLTSVDFALFMDHYEVYNLEYISGFYFHGMRGVFKEYIDKWMKIKAETVGAERELAKLMLNSLYGKFATNPVGRKKIPRLDEKGIVRFTFTEKEERDPVYLPMGAFITAYARNWTIRAGQTVYPRLIYADTDSWALKGIDMPGWDIHPTKLGAWKYEGSFFKGKYLCAKRYMNSFHHDEKYSDELLENLSKDALVNSVYTDFARIYWDQEHVTCAGMPDNVKQQVTYKNFHPGHVYHGKLMPTHVPGGIYLRETEWAFTD